MHRLLPQRLSRDEIETNHLPHMLRGRDFRPIATEIEPLLRRFRFTAVDDRGQKHPLAPNHRRRPSPTGNRRLPLHVFRDRPFVRQVRIGGNAPRIRSAKLRPVFDGVGVNHRGTEHTEEQKRSDGEVEFGCHGWSKGCSVRRGNVDNLSHPGEGCWLHGACWSLTFQRWREATGECARCFAPNPFATHRLPCGGLV